MEKTIITGKFTKKNIIAISFIVLAIISIIISVLIYNP